MTSSFFHQLDRAARNVTPLLTSLLLVLISALPFHVPDFGRVSPNVAFMVVFYWSIYRPDRFPAWAAFAVGLWQDVLIGTPLGMNALVALLVHWAVSNQRRFFQGKSFFVVWWAFALVAVGVALLVWLLMMVLSSTLMSPAPGLVQLVLTIALYPFLTWFLAGVQHVILRDA